MINWNASTTRMIVSLPLFTFVRHEASYKIRIVGMHEPYEWVYEWSPAWKYVGKHMHFAPWLLEVADGMVKRALGISEAGELPPVRLSSLLFVFFFGLIFNH